MQFNQKSVQSYTGLLKALYSNARTRDTMQYDAAYGRTEGVVSANRNGRQESL